MTAIEPTGSTWLRDLIRRQNDPAERSAGRAALRRRLFGTPEPHDTDDKPDDGPDVHHTVGHARP